MSEDGKNKPAGCHYHDGGPDHNLRFPRTQLAQIAYFTQRNLDLLILVHTTPNHSWKNPAERVMSNLNLALPGISVMRVRTKSMEQHLQAANSLKAIRELSKKHRTLEEEVKESIEPCKTLIGSVFSRLQLKGKSFKVFSAATNEDLLQPANQLKRIDGEFDLKTLLPYSQPSQPVKMSLKLQQFIDNHCVKGHYQFSIKKCSDEECVCGAPRAIFARRIFTASLPTIPSSATRWIPSL